MCVSFSFASAGLSIRSCKTVHEQVLCRAQFRYYNGSAEVGSKILSDRQLGNPEATVLHKTSSQKTFNIGVGISSTKSRGLGPLESDCFSNIFLVNMEACKCQPGSFSI